jgi:hypothetical protein
MLPMVTDDGVTPVESWNAAAGMGARPWADGEVLPVVPVDVVDEQAASVAVATIRTAMGMNSLGEQRRVSLVSVTVSASPIHAPSR